MYFVYHGRQGADGGKEQKFGRVRQEKEPQTFILSKDNADSHISMQVIQTRLKLQFLLIHLLS